LKKAIDDLDCATDTALRQGNIFAPLPTKIFEE